MAEVRGESRRRRKKCHYSNEEIGVLKAENFSRVENQTSGRIVDSSIQACDMIVLVTNSEGEWKACLGGFFVGDDLSWKGI